MKKRIVNIAIFFLCADIASGCSVSPTRQEAPPENFTKGVYEPFATDNLVPEIPEPYLDNDENYYPVYYYN